MILKNRILFLFFFCGLLTLNVWSDDLSKNIPVNLNARALDDLTKDLGALMGGGSFHQGKALGFPIGLDIGVHVPVVRVRAEDAILKADNSSIQALWGQAELGLPGKINLIGRVGKAFDADLVGGGARFGLVNAALVSLSVAGLYGEMKHDFFKLKTYTANAVISIDFPFIRPYLGGGYDDSRFKPTDKAFVGPGTGASRSLEGKARGYRAEAGINLSVIPFTYITIGGGLANGRQMYHAGAGVKF